MPCNNGRIISKYVDLPIYQNGVLIKMGSNHEMIQCPLAECPVNKQPKNENSVDNEPIS